MQKCCSLVPISFLQKVFVFFAKIESFIFCGEFSQKTKIISARIFAKIYFVPILGSGKTWQRLRSIELLLSVTEVE